MWDLYNGISYVDKTAALYGNIPPMSEVLTNRSVKPSNLAHKVSTHWGRVTHICVGELTIIGSDNGLSPGRRQAIIWTNAGILLIGPLGTNFSEISIEILTFSFKKMHLKMASAKWRLFGLGLNELKHFSTESVKLGSPGVPHSGIILWIWPANETWCYIVTLLLIGWAHTQNDPYSLLHV